MKLTAPSGGNTNSSGDGMSSDQLGALMKMIEDLGVDITAETAKKYATKDSIKEFATIDSVKSLENDMASIYLRIKILETKTIELAETDTKLQGSIQSLEKLGARHTREIEELREQLKKQPAGSSISLANLPKSTGGDDSVLIELIKAMEAKLNDKADSDDVRKANNKFEDAIDAILARLKKMEDNQKISDGRIQVLEDLIAKL